MFEKHGYIGWMVASVFLLCCFPALGDLPKDPTKDPIKKEKDVPADKLSGESIRVKAKNSPTPTTQVAPTTRPQTPTSPSVSQDERTLFFARWRWATISRYSLAANMLLLLDAETLLQRYPQDLALQFRYAWLSLFNGHSHVMDTFCAATSTNTPAFYLSYCRAWEQGQISEYTAQPDDIALLWLTQLKQIYQKNPKDRDLRYHIIHFFIAQYYKIKHTPHKTFVHQLLKDDLQENPTDVWVKTYALAARLGTLVGQRSALIFLLPEIQNLAEKHANHIGAQMLLWFVAQRLHVRSILETTKIRMETLTQGTDLWSQFHRYIYLLSKKDYPALIKHLDNMIGRAVANPQQERLYVDLLHSIVGSLWWRLRHKITPLYGKLLKHYPKHPRILVLLGQHHQRLKQTDKAQQMYLQAVPLVEDDRTLRDLYWKISYRNRPLAMQLINHYLRRYPGHIWALSRRADLYKQRQEKGKAEQDYQTLLAQKKALPASVYADIARHYQYSSHYPQSLKICQIALQKHPNAAQLYALRAAVYTNLNKHSEASADYLKAFQLYPTSSWYGRSYVTSLFQQGQTQKALDFLKKQATQNTASSSFWKKMWIEFLYKAGKTAEAQAIALRSGNPESLMASGQGLVQKKQYAQAIAMFQAALLKTSKPYLRRSLYGQIAESYKKLGQLKKAEETYRKLIDIDPNYYYSYYTLSSFYLYKTKEIQKAIALWGEYLQRKPSDSNGYYQRADAYRQAKDLLAALLNYLQGFEKSKKARWDHDRVANFLSWTARRKDLAISIWNEYIAKFPKDPHGYRQRASLLVQNRQFEAAEKDYRKAIALAPKELYTYTSLANLYLYQLKQPQQALDLWTLFLQQYPKNAQAYRNRASLYRSQKAYQKAIQDLEMSLQIDPNNQYAYSPLASLYRYDLKDNTKAIGVWTKFISVRPYLSGGYMERARLWALEKNWVNALADWQAANTRERWSWRRREILQGMALCQRHLQQYDLAIQNLHKAISLTSSSYALRTIWKDLALTYEAKGDYNKALKTLTSIPTSSWDRSPLWMKIRFLVGAGQVDQALALALSLCSGPQPLPRVYERKQACYQHQWIEYYTRLLQPPISLDAFTQLVTPPVQKRSSRNAFRNILQFLLKAKGTQNIVQPRTKKTK